MLHTIELYYNKKGFSEATTLYTRRGDTGELLSATFKDEIDELLVLPEGTTTFDVSKVYFEAEGNGVFVRREVPAKYLDLTTPKKPRIKNFPMPAEMFAKGPNVVDNCYFRFELKTGAPTLDTDSPVTVSSSSFNTIVLGSPIPGIRSYYLDEIDYLIKEFEKAIAGYTPADIEQFYADLKAEIKLAKEQAKQDIEDLNALFVQSEADLRAKIVREIADMNKLIQNMQTSLDAQLLELQKQIDATKAQITTLDNKLVQVETDITNAKKEINQVKIDTTAEINQVKEDTAAQITKVKNDASTEINKIKNESILAVTAEKEAVIKMINDLKAEIVAMDLEQMVLDLFAQGKVKDVMVAEIQKEVTKQLTEKGAASQKWVEDNAYVPLDEEYINMIPYFEVGGIVWKSGITYPQADRIRTPFIDVKQGQKYIFSLKGKPLAVHVFEYDKNGVYLGDDTFASIQRSDYTPTKPEVAKVKLLKSGSGFTAIWAQIKMQIDGPMTKFTRGYPDFYRLEDPKNGFKWYNDNSLISQQANTQVLEKTSIDWTYVTQAKGGPPGIGSDIFIKRIFITENYGKCHAIDLFTGREFTNFCSQGAWRGWKEINISGQTTKITADNGRQLFYFEDGTKTFHEMVIAQIKTTGYFKVQTFSTKGQPEQCINGMINVQLVNDNPLYYSYYFTGVAVGSGKMYSYSFHSQKDFGWSNVDGQVQKITLDSGQYKEVSGPDKTTLQAFKELGTGVHFVYIINKLKDTPVPYLKGIVTVSSTALNEITFIGEEMVSNRGTYSYNGMSNTWKRLDGQVAKLTSDDGGSYITLSDKSKTTQEMLDGVDKGYKFITFGEASDLPSNWIYGFISTNGTGGFKSFLGTGNDGAVYNYNSITKVWKRLDNESTTPAYPKEIPTASIGRYPTDKNTYQRDYIKAQLISETLLKVVGIITIYQDATLPNSVTVASISKSAQLGGKKLPTLMSQRKIASVRNTSGSNYESELNVSLADTGSSINVDINIFAFKGTLGASPNKIYIDVDIPLE